MAFGWILELKVHRLIWHAVKLLHFILDMERDSYFMYPIISCVPWSFVYTYHAKSVRLVKTTMLVFRYSIEQSSHMKKAK